MLQPGPAGELNTSVNKSMDAATKASPSTDHGALAGIRVTDFCWWGVGAVATRLLADFGAQVMKIESPNRLDYIRSVPPTPDGLAMPGEIAKVGDVNRSGYFHNHNRNKHSVGINMKSDRGRAIVRDLIAHSDVVTDNYRPGVMERLELSFEQMKELNSTIVWVSVSGNGQTGPAAGYGTNGPVCQALSGLSATAGMPGQPPSGYGYSYMDQTAGYYGSIAVLMALYAQARTGQAQRVDVSSIEVGINLLGPSILDVTANDRPYDRRRFPSANRNHAARVAPHGVYPTSERDRWIAITVFDDAQWNALVEVMGRPAWAGRRFATNDQRYATQDQLDRRVADWTRTQARYPLMDRLQRVGVAAGVVQTAEDKVRRDPQLRIRNTFPVVPNDTIGPWPVQGIPFKMSKSPPDEPFDGAPRLGADTRSVLSEVLGYSDSMIDEYADRGEIYCDE